MDRAVVKEAYVGKSVVMKRFALELGGRGSRILKPLSHLTIVVSEKEEQA